MRSLILLAPLALLAACSGNKAANNVAANAAAPATTTNAAAPVSMAPASNSSSVPAPGGANDPRRANLLAECNEAVPGVVPAGSDVAGICNCAVDRVLGGEGEEAATMACAGQLGVTVDPTKM